MLFIKWCSIYLPRTQTFCIYCCIALDSMPTVYAKCYFCLRKDLCFVWWKLLSVCVHVWSYVQSSPSSFNVWLLLALKQTFHIRHFGYMLLTVLHSSLWPIITHGIMARHLEWASSFAAITLTNLALPLPYHFKNKMLFQQITWLLIGCMAILPWQFKNTVLER